MAYTQKSSSSSSAVRRRISKACNYCRQRKIKCNGNSPCANCKNHTVDCIYTKTIRKKKRAPVKKLTLQELEKRVTTIDEKFDLLNEKLSQVISILTQNKLADKSLGEIMTHKNSISSDAFSDELDSSEDEDLEEGDEGYYEEPEDGEEDEASSASSPIESEVSYEPSTSTNTGNILTPPDDEFQFMPRLTTVQYPNMANDQLSSFGLSGMGVASMQEHLNVMENKLLMSFDTVNHLGQQLEQDQTVSIGF